MTTSNEASMTRVEKVTTAIGLSYLFLVGSGVGFAFWFASDVGSWGWLLPPFFAAGFIAGSYDMWLHIRQIICRVRLEEIDRHIAQLDEIRRAL